MNYRAVFTQMMEFKEKNATKKLPSKVFSPVDEGDAFAIDECTEYVKTGH